MSHTIPTKCSVIYNGVMASKWSKIRKIQFEFVLQQGILCVLMAVTQKHFGGRFEKSLGELKNENIYQISTAMNR